ncbi:DUF4309 domain-containing protein [Paenibacillus sp. J2TS4]|uniref:DUF4309 domain-containing protein n=1 Tax=Paenibacillus sp. J2TS4 TaxID=2807194 RepID=UPI001B26A9C4|nr:DUF4309 domain-containing protein [Paenibacillus sp. J2TS4]GIP36436.1 hypothetical protein J2TS4_56460 [Paenibacillus sp. J2TS4]
MRIIQALFVVVTIAGLLAACTTPELSEGQPPADTESVPDDGKPGITDTSATEVLAAIKDEAAVGQMKDVEIPLGSTFHEVVERYGEQEEIGNEECWTYSFGHTSMDIFFYYNHDSCSSADEINRLQPDAILNKISVSPDLYHIQVTEKDIKETLGEPDEDYWRESYGGYFLIYNLGEYQLEFITDENSPAKEVYQINIVSSN